MSTPARNRSQAWFREGPTWQRDDLFIAPEDVLVFASLAQAQVVPVDLKYGALRYDGLLGCEQTVIEELKNVVIASVFESHLVVLAPDRVLALSTDVLTDMRLSSSE